MMPGGEHVPDPSSLELEASPGPRVKTLVDLAEARTNVGSERAHGRTSLRDQEGLQEVDSEGSPTATSAELHYRSAVLAEATNAAREAQERGAGDEEVIRSAAERLANEMLLRENAETQARQNPETRRGQLAARFESVWRKHPVARFAIGIGLAAGAVAAVASGAGAVAIGLAVARGGLSTIGVSMSGQAAQEWGSAIHQHREGGDKASLGETEAEAAATAAGMDDEQRWQRFSALLSGDASKGRSQKQEAADQATRVALYSAEVQAGVDAMRAKVEAAYNGSPEQTVRAIMTVLDQRLAGHLVAERQQLQHDKGVNRRRTVVAAAMGVAAGALTGVTGVEHAHVAGAHQAARHAASRLHEHVTGHHTSGTTGGTEAPTHAAESAAHVTETHPSTFANYPEVVVDQADKGDTPYTVALKHLSRIQGWSHFSAADQHEKAMHFANQLNKAGDHWRYTKEAIRTSFGFEHGVVPPDQLASAAGHGVLPSYEQVAPSGGGAEHVLPSGGVAAPDTHEFALAAHGGEVHASSFANYPEIVTQHVRWGDSPLRVARAQLSHIQGWSQFSESEQHEKALHLANQLNKVGDHWRYTKEAIQASFNFK